MNRPAPWVAVVGAGTAGAAESDTDLAEAVGRELARRGAVVVCGGLGGVMEAACRGARQAGGLTVGILPGSDRSTANPWVAVAIATGLGEARNTVVATTADSVIAVGGEFGTLSEIAFALKVGKTVIALGSWGLEHPHGHGDPLVRATGAADAADRAVAAADRRGYTWP